MRADLPRTPRPIRHPSTLPPQFSSSSSRPSPSILPGRAKMPGSPPSDHPLGYRSCVAERMADKNRHDHAALGAVVILGAGILAEGARLVLVRPWPGFEPGTALAASAVLVAVWVTSLVAVLLRRRFHASATAAWFATFVAPITMLAHAAVTRVAGNWWGLAYIPAAIAVSILLKRCFDRGELTRLDGLHGSTAGR